MKALTLMSRQRRSITKVTMDMDNLPAGISDGNDQNDHVIVFKQTFDRLAETMNVTFC
jgi:hypothetical protein